MNSEPVEVFPAYRWDCPDCGREHFERAVVYEFAPAERAEMERELDLPIQTGDWMTHPTEVTCSHCNQVFKTKHFGEASKCPPNEHGE